MSKYNTKIKAVFKKFNESRLQLNVSIKYETLTNYITLYRQNLCGF